MRPEDRRLILGVCVVLGAATLSTATFNQVILPMLDTLQATESQQSLLRQLPSVGALLVIFLAGVLGTIVGSRRFVVSCALVMAAGYFLVMVSPGMPLTSLGLLVGSIGQQGLLVIAIKMLGAGLSSPDSRASGFAALAMVSPITYLVGPIVAGAIVDLASWRIVIGLWCLIALAAAPIAWRLLPPDAASDGEPVELWTPALAGFVLACLVQTLNNLSVEGLTGRATVAWFAAGVCASLVLVILMRRLAHPSLDISFLGHGGFRLLLVVVMLVPFASLSYYTMVGLQYVYGYGEFRTALIMAPSELTSIAGAWLSGWLIRRKGIRYSGTIALLIMSGALFLSTTQTVSKPIVVSQLILCLYTAALSATNAPITNSIMNLAAKGAEGSAAAFRGASESLGIAIGVVLMSTIVYSSFQTSLTARLDAAGRDTSQVPAIIQSLREQLSSEQVASKYSVPLDEVEIIGEERREAMVDAYQAQGLVGGIIVLLAAGVFFFYKGDRDGVAESAAEVSA